MLKQLMAVGKNKKLGKSKGKKKKQQDAFARKEWYEVKAPGIFRERNVCKTVVNRTAGLKIASEALKGRVFDVSLADLNKDEDQAYRKIRLVVEEVNGRECLTNFHGMDFARDRLCALIKKWQTLIEGNCDVKTADGYSLRMFCIGFTNKRSNQNKKTAYAQAAQIRLIRAKMVEIMTREAVKCDLKELVLKFLPETISKEIEKAVQGIYPLKDVYIRKVKVLSKPKFEMAKLMEMHEAVAASQGEVVERNEKAAKKGLVGSGGRL